MIFSSVNEDGVPAYKLIALGDKDRTRRQKPKRVGAVIAVQPARATKSVCKCGHLHEEHHYKNDYSCPIRWYEPLRVRVLSCEKHLDWVKRTRKLTIIGRNAKEAHREGFKSWVGLLAWFKEHKIDINSTYRLGFEVVK